MGCGYNLNPPVLTPSRLSLMSYPSGALLTSGHLDGRVWWMGLVTGGKKVGRVGRE